MPMINSDLLAPEMVWCTFSIDYDIEMHQEENIGKRLLFFAVKYQWLTWKVKDQANFLHQTEVFKISQTL